MTPTLSPARPLQTGDHLTRAEFVHRSESVTPGTAAELLAGVVHVRPSAVPFTTHAGPSFDVIGLLGLYTLATPGVRGGAHGSVFLADDTLVQLDVFLMRTGGGTATVNADGFIIGPPELVVEIADASADYDLHQKLNVYRSNGVPEYLVWRTLDSAFDCFRLDAGRYDRVVPPADGVYRSAVLPGLWLNTAALLAGDVAQAAADVHRGTATAEHAAFVADLQQRTTT